MRVERVAVSALLATIGISSAIAYVKHEEEFARRTGLKGTSTLGDGQGAAIEYLATGPRNDKGLPTLVLDAGLGAPLETWDWVRWHLKDEFFIIQYHRTGYGRTKSTERPHRLIELLLSDLSPEGPVILCGHSLGALVAANCYADSPTLRRRTRALVAVDGTDATLLAEARASKTQSGRQRQSIRQDMIGAVTGINNWVLTPTERDVEYRPDIQRCYKTMSGSPFTLHAALREMDKEPLHGQEAVANSGLEVRVVSAADNVEQQQVLAKRLGAKLAVVPESSHRSIIGRIECAAVVADVIRDLP